MLQLIVMAYIKIIIVSGSQLVVRDALIIIIFTAYLDIIFI